LKEKVLLNPFISSRFYSRYWQIVRMVIS